MVKLKNLAPKALSCLERIDVSETGDFLYKIRGLELVTHLENWKRKPWSDSEIAKIRRMILERIKNGGEIYGAYIDEQIVGLMAIAFDLEPRVTQLVGLWVDKNHRRQQVAQTLVKSGFESALAHGSNQVYVSSTPSKSAVNFYLSMGFAPTSAINEKLFRLEPDDIHMRCELLNG